MNTDNVLVVKVVPDYDMINPCEYDSWKVYSFGRSHGSYKDPDTFIEDFVDGEPQYHPDIQEKLTVGLAFELSYYEHGLCDWWVRGAETGYHPDMRWDGARLAGLVIWEDKEENLGGTTYVDRMKDASSFMQMYTSWCNGDGLGYVIRTLDDEDVDSCFGFYGHNVDDFVAEVAYAVGDSPYVFDMHTDTPYHYDDIEKAIGRPPAGKLVETVVRSVRTGD